MTLKLLGNNPRGKLFIVSAPAGTGKTTLVRMLMKEFPLEVVENVSFTTRSPRLGEVEGKDYYFISKEEFEEKIRKGEFLEYAQVFGYYYGTCNEHVEKQLNSGKHVALVIDTQGAMQLKGKVSATFVFVKPPSIEELKNRLIQRNSDTLNSIEKRLSWAQKEIEASKNYDYCIVNDKLELAYGVLRSILIAEEHRV